MGILKGEKKKKTVILNEMEKETGIKRNTLVQQIKRGNRGYENPSMPIKKEESGE